MADETAIDDDLMMELGACAEIDAPVPVHVVANDYACDGWIVAAFEKRGGAKRCVVEDPNGRLFIHNSRQLRAPSEEPTP